MKYKDKSTKIGAYKWIWIANKFAKFHPKRLNRSENIPKSFFFGGGLLFIETLYKLLIADSSTQHYQTHHDVISPTHIHCQFCLNALHTATYKQTTNRQPNTNNDITSWYFE